MIATETTEDGWRILQMGLFGFVVLLFLTVWKHFGLIEEDLVSRSRAALNEQGLVIEDISASGRALTLQGELDDAEQRTKAQQIVEAVDGVRKVTNEITLDRRHRSGSGSGTGD